MFYFGLGISRRCSGRLVYTDNEFYPEFSLIYFSRLTMDSFWTRLKRCNDCVLWQKISYCRVQIKTLYITEYEYTALIRSHRERQFSWNIKVDFAKSSNLIKIFYTAFTQQPFGKSNCCIFLSLPAFFCFI